MMGIQINQKQKKHLYHIGLSALLLVILLLWNSPLPTRGWTNPSLSPPNGNGGFISDNFPNIGIGTTTPIDRLTIGAGSLYQGAPVNSTVVGGHQPCPNGIFCNLTLTTGGIIDFTVSGRYGYAVATVNANPVPRLRILELSDPTHPKVIGGHAMDGDPRHPSGGGVDYKKIIVSGNYAYLLYQGTTGKDVLRIADISNPLKPYIIGGQNLVSDSLCGAGKMPDYGATDMAISGQYLFITFNFDGNCALRILDVTNPASPTVIGGQNMESVNSGPGRWPQAFGDNPAGIAVSGRYAYVIFDNGSGPINNYVFRVVDISNPQKPFSVGGYDIGTNQGMPDGSFLGKLVTVAGRYVYLGFYTNASFPGQGPKALANMIRILDISDPISPRVVGGAGIATQDPILSHDDDDGDGEPVVWPNDFAISGRYLYVLLENDNGDPELGYLDEVGRQFRIIDVGDPENPRIVGGDKLTENMPSRPNAGLDNSPQTLAVSGKYAYIGFPFSQDPGDPDEAAARERIFRVVDLNGIESTSMLAHSLDAGSLQVITSATVDNSLTVKGSLSVGNTTFLNGSTTMANLTVRGVLTKSAGTFLIDHPLDPLHKTLSHSFVESPDMKNIYDGIVTLNKAGEATIQLPSYFEALNKEFRYLFTPIGAPAPDLYIKEKINNNHFTIAGGPPFVKVSWQVTGVRKDRFAEAHPIEVEKEKSVPGYIHPELYEGN